MTRYFSRRPTFNALSSPQSRNDRSVKMRPATLRMFYFNCKYQGSFSNITGLRIHIRDVCRMTSNQNKSVDSSMGRSMDNNKDSNMDRSMGSNRNGRYSPDSNNHNRIRNMDMPHTLHTLTRLILRNISYFYFNTTVKYIKRVAGCFQRMPEAGLIRYTLNMRCALHSLSSFFLKPG